MLGNCAVCEYERGSLEAKVEDGTYVERTLEGLDLLVRIARELEKLHNAGVAHRDLKPANILLGDDGPLLADFGLSCRLIIQMNVSPRRQNKSDRDSTSHRRTSQGSTTT
jgi:serine/threonine protein kinase